MYTHSKTLEKSDTVKKTVWLENDVYIINNLEEYLILLPNVVKYKSNATCQLLNVAHMDHTENSLRNQSV